jgi:hypothetical protein
MSEYAGKWYSNLFGKPDELAFVLKTEDIDSPGQGDQLMNIRLLYLTKKYVAFVEKTFGHKAFGFPLKGYEIQRPKQKLVIKIFNKLEFNRTFF